MHTCDAFLNVFALTDDLREKQKCSGMRKRRRVFLGYQFCYASIENINGVVKPGYAGRSCGPAMGLPYGHCVLR